MYNDFKSYNSKSCRSGGFFDVMGKVICISNQKGGVGKTTSVNAIALGLKHKGYRVLCVDFDPQGNLSFSLMADNRVELQNSIYHVMKKQLRAIQTIQHTELMDIIPSNILLSGIELEFTSTGREYILRDALSPLIPDYDYIIIDTPPALGILTVNAFTAADIIIMPVLSDLFSLQGIVQLSDTVRRVKERSNPGLVPAGVFLTRYNPREYVSRVIRESTAEITQKLGIPFLSTSIRNSSVMSKVQILRKNMFNYAPRNHAVNDYLSLIDELFEGGYL